MTALTLPPHRDRQKRKWENDERGMKTVISTAISSRRKNTTWGFILRRRLILKKRFIFRTWGSTEIM